MAYKQVRDVIDGIRAFHRKLGDLYQRMGEVADKERLKILLEYMSRHEQNIDDYLDRFEKDVASRRILESWVKARTDEEPLMPLETESLQADMSSEQIMRTALEMDERLIGFYEKMSRLAETEEARDMFSALLKHERREEVKLVRDTIEFVQD